VEVPRGAELHELRALVADRANALRDQRVSFVTAADPHVVVAEATLGELGVVVDEERVVALATRLGHDGELLERASLARRARRGELDVALMPTIATDIAMARLLAVKEAWDVVPVSARLDLEHHDVLAEKPGSYIDAYDALAAVDALARSRSARSASGFDGHEGSAASVVTLAAVSFAPRMTRAFLRSLDIKTVLGSFETYFSRGGDQARRGKNIDVAAAKLEGLVLASGEMVSFNEVVGERSEDNGFQKSWEILKGEMIEGVGGGTCQVASTFHAAAFFAGFEVLERLPHSRPSAYIPMGLDSTVVYPAVDLKLRNPHAFPVVVHTRVVGNALRIELLGAAKPVSVSFKRELEKVYPYKRKIVEDATLGGVRVVLKQHGIRGYRVKRTRELAYADGSRKSEETTDTYPATAEIYEVPPGFDEARLPPLPEEAVPDEGSPDAEFTDREGSGGPSDPPPVASVEVAVPVHSLPSLPSLSSTAAQASPSSSPPPGDDVRREAESRGLVLTEGAGSHAPTKAQADPPKELTIRR
jgi:VanW like protein/Putative peptidoglycan binding domain